MMTFTDDGWEEYVHWQNEDRKTIRKINKLMESIKRDGVMKGEGKPEKLKNEINTYSRRIDEKNRLVYIAANGNCTITSCRGHYEED